MLEPPKLPPRHATVQSLSSVHEKQFSACVCNTGGRPASRSSRFVYMVLCGREAAREAKTGRVLFASMSVVIREHVFAENGSRGAAQ